MTVLAKVENHMACWIFTDQKRYHDEASVVAVHGRRGAGGGQYYESGAVSAVSYVGSFEGEKLVI